ARQWKRGIASSNTQIQDLDYFRSHEVSLSSLGRIFNEEFSTRNYSKTLAPGALSKHFAWRKRDGMVYMYDREIGHYKDGIFI
ncbi:hypothetical protein, partial [Streptococcus pneumoniae]|uniref:hypothetical protein n=1 Tax=Streptococcus pneumoniae TaxID=1313 RepID=UPI0018B090CE